jgi:hypothetical protein
MRAVIKARVSRIHVVTMVERQRKTDSSWLQVPRLGRVHAELSSKFALSGVIELAIALTSS